MKLNIHPESHLMNRTLCFTYLIGAALMALSFSHPCKSAVESTGNPSPRTATPLVEWQFAEDSPSGALSSAAREKLSWAPVQVPHVFRQSGLPDNTAGWYRRRFTLPVSNAKRACWLVLEGAAAVKEVFVNGHHIGQHKGAFSWANFDLTPAMKADRENTLEVRVSNRDEEALDCFSRSKLYYVNGGMFRKAWLITTGPVHVNPDMGSTGLYLTPRMQGSESGEINTRAFIRNSLEKSPEVTTRYFVQDPSGAVCAQFEKKQIIPAGEVVIIETTGTIPRPRLWDLGKPNLYAVRLEVAVNGTITDELTERTGFRSIAWKENRFFLNGRSVQFRGVCKHAQDESSWNALSDSELRKDWDSMMAMGVNAVRLTHYPHARLEYDIADEQGIAVWAENGYAGEPRDVRANEWKAATPEGERLTREMIHQNWNHPSILFWSAGNETVINAVSGYASVIRSEDTSRLVTYASNTAAHDREPTNCDFIAENTYDGWYGKNDYSKFAEIPRNALISETGAGNWTTHHVPYGTIHWEVNRFEPEEYAELFTEFRIQTICRNDVANHPMFFGWCFREIYDRKFKNVRNTKGLVSLAGTPKDLYFLYQAFFNSTKPVVHLVGRNHFLRTFAADNGIKAYSNAPELELILNGTPQGKLKNGSYRQPDSESNGKDGSLTAVTGIPVDNVFFWKTPLHPGRNLIDVTDGKGNCDAMVIYQQTSGAPMPEAPNALVQDLRSSNPENPACYIDRPIEAQGPFYSGVDGSSDNTFDTIPEVLTGASWIATRRMSDPKLKSDLSFRIGKHAPGATVFVLFSRGGFPTVTLKPANREIVNESAKFEKVVADAGFAPTGIPVVWHDHDLNRADAALWMRKAAPGEEIKLPAATLDYLILVRSVQPK